MERTAISLFLQACRQKLQSNRYSLKAREAFAGHQPSKSKRSAVLS